MLQKKAPKGLKPLDAELKSAPAFRRPTLRRILPAGRRRRAANAQTLLRDLLFRGTDRAPDHTFTPYSHPAT